MNRSALGALAVIIMLLMVMVSVAGLDNLPRQLKSEVDNSARQLETERSAFVQNQDAIARDLASEPALFRTKALQFRKKLDDGKSCLASAAAELATLQNLAKRNRRSETAQVRSELSKFDSVRKGCSTAADMRAEADRWVQYKRELPQRITALNTSYEAVHAFDVDAAAASAKKAEADWPAKREDIETRVAQLKQVKSEAEQAWDASAKLRSEAKAGPKDEFDYAGLFQTADRLDDASRRLTSGTESVNQLAAQLYTSWDKLLLDVDDNHGLREKVRLVRTKYKDATLANGEASSEEHWEETEAARKRDAEKQIGMVVARKPAGKYDSEVERAVQPPAIAYVAPPGQSNSYGSWQNGAWNWLPQYLILSHLLNASRGPITAPDYEGYYQARRRGETYYGRGDGFQWWHGSRTLPSTGGGGVSASRSSPGSSGSTGGGFYKERPKTYGNSGGYSGSQYQNRGSYSGSRYQPRGGFSPGSSGSRSYSRGGGFGGGGGRSFGRGGRR